MHRLFVMTTTVLFWRTRTRRSVLLSVWEHKSTHGLRFEESKVLSFWVSLFLDMSRRFRSHQQKVKGLFWLLDDLMGASRSGRLRR
jgi:hypothetical protein